MFKPQFKLQPASATLPSSILLAALALPPLLFLLLFYFYPLAAIFKLSFAPAGQLDLSALGKLVTTTYYAKTLWFTVWQAALSTALTLGAALPAAYVFARYRFPGKSLLQALTTIPFVLPTLVAANAFTALFGPRGLLNQGLMAWFGLDAPPIHLQHTLWIILLAHVFYNYAIVLRLVSGFWANLNPNLSEAGQMLGLSPWRAFRQITVPLLAPAITAAALLVFIFCFTSFGVILILGGPRFATLEVEIYRQAVYLFNLPVAAALSLIQIVFIFILMTTYTRLQARASRPLDLQSRQAGQRRPQNRRERLLVGGNVGLMVILLGSPLLALALRSLTIDGQLSFTYYQALITNPAQNRDLFFVPPGEAITNSLAFAAGTVILAALLGLLIALALSRGRAARTANLDAVFMLPLATSAVTLGFGYIITMNKPPLNLRASPLLIVLAHTLVALPFVVRSLLPALRSIQPALREAAAVLGASPLRVWRQVDLPIAGRALLVGAVFAFTISMGEFGATVFIARPDTPTMPTAIFRFFSQPGPLNYGQALAMSALLMLVCVVGFVAIERFRVGDGEF
ncbi:MAG: iron ABC transporter permease [Anaerolineae bacterium]|nr:iron ABC transporter permease [Anaerolineae bacterium]